MASERCLTWPRRKVDLAIQKNAWHRLKRDHTEPRFVSETLRTYGTLRERLVEASSSIKCGSKLFNRQTDMALITKRAILSRV